MRDDIGAVNRAFTKPGRPELGSDIHKLERRYADIMEAGGFVHISGLDMAKLTANADLSPLLAWANALPADPYTNGSRRRALSYRVFDPRTGKLMSEPVFCDATGLNSEYYQDPRLNSDQGGRTRRFHVNPDEVMGCDLLSHMVSLLWRQLPYGVDTKLLWLIGFHVIQLNSDGQQACVPSPNEVHCDGEYFTAITLLDRVNVTPSSARNWVCRRHAANHHIHDVPEEDILWQGTMTEPLETLFTDDSRVAHGVSGVLGADAKPGWRTSMLIDFTPLLLGRTPPPSPRGK